MYMRGSRQRGVSHSASSSGLKKVATFQNIVDTGVNISSQDEIEVSLLNDSFHNAQIMRATEIAKSL